MTKYIIADAVKGNLLVITPKNWNIIKLSSKLENNFIMLTLK